MKLDANATLEQVVLAMVAEEAGRVLETGNGYLGRTAIQKIMYFLQVCGVPIRYRFDVHHYGPFCSAILRDIDWLVFTGALVNTSSNPDRYANYRIQGGAGQILAEPDSQLESYRGIIRSVVSTMLPMSPDQMELMSTLHYAHRELLAERPEHLTKETVIARFRDFKHDKFSESVLEETYERMRQAGFFEAARA